MSVSKVSRDTRSKPKPTPAKKPPPEQRRKEDKAAPQRAAAQNATKPVNTDPAFPSEMSPPMAAPTDESVSAECLASFDGRVPHGKPIWLITGEDECKFESPPLATPRIEMGGSGLSLFFEKSIGRANAAGFKQVGEGHFESDGNYTRYWLGETDSPPANQTLRMEQIDDDTYELSNNTQLK
jgi:hypothetical protein